MKAEEENLSSSRSSSKVSHTVGQFKRLLWAGGSATPSAVVGDKLEVFCKVVFPAPFGPVPGEVKQD